MKRAKALELINKQLNEIPILKTVKEEDKKYKEWKGNTLAVVKSIFGEESSNYKKAKEHLFPPFFCDPFDGPQDYHAIYLRRLDIQDTILRGMITEVEIWEDNIETGINPVDVIKNICSRFSKVVFQMKIRYKDRNTLDVADEYDVQNLFHSLLRLHFDDIEAEAQTPKYAGSSSRIDFLLKPEQIGIEIKHTRDGMNSNKLGEELMIDIARYKSHPDCKTLIFFVYDPKYRIINPSRIELDLSKEVEGMKVIIIITPQR